MATKWDLISRFAFNGTVAYFTEYRHSSKMRLDFEALIRDLYEGSSVGRGHKDLSVVRYPLIAPTVVTGEDVIEDKASIERSVVIHFMADDTIKRGTDAYTAMKEMRALPLEEFAVPYYTFLLRLLENPNAITELIYQARKLCDAVLGNLDFPDRIGISLSVVVIGLLSYSKFLSEYGILFEINVSLLSKILPFALTNAIGDRGRVETPLDRFIEDIVNEAWSQTQFSSPRASFVYRVMEDEATHKPVFWFNLKSAYNWWRQKCIKSQQDIVSEPVIKTQLKEHRKYYTLPSTTINIDTSSRLVLERSGLEVKNAAAMHGIRLYDAAASGLEIPSWGAIHTNGNGHGKIPITERNMR